MFTITLRLNASYVGKPTAPADFRAVLKKSIEFKCEYQGGDGEFVQWFKDGVAVSTEPEGHYVVTTSPTESTLKIKIIGKKTKFFDRF